MILSGIFKTAQRARRPRGGTEEQLADRPTFTLDDESWDAFLTALDALPRRRARLDRLFREPSVSNRQGDL
ncbi:MAG TPA: DUF1778 domain-containing protein [Xanthobacteraceae bacterium]|nr:DUF1778 domain-containing protein [Xanthobacteraceae bacterium]